LAGIEANSCDSNAEFVFPNLPISDLSRFRLPGADKIVVEDYEDIDVKLDFTANNFAGLDRFGRVVDQLWSDYSGTPTPVDQYKYTYDRAGNRTSRQNVLADAAAQELSEAYLYDALDRLIDSDRGHFSGGLFVKSSDDQSWVLDGLGNFGTFTDQGTSQTRTVNAANEIQTISGTWADPTYDEAGNMISGPKPGSETTRLHYEYDAWHRLVAVYADDSQNPGEPGALIAAYEYDATNRRIEKTVTPARQVDYFYNQDWQLLEERCVDASGATSDQYVWSARYIDAPIVRFHDGGFAVDTGEKIVASDPAAGDAFGDAVAIDGDTMIVGARFDDDAYGDTGSGYVFVRSGASSAEEVKLTVSDPYVPYFGDYFGCSVAICGDYAVVGALGDDTYGSQSGAAYVFVRSGTSWSLQARLTALDAQEADWFGCSVAIFGDTVIVGARGDDDGGSQSGSAYIFVRSGTTWSQQAKLTAGPDAAADALFGCSVAVSGDTVVVGARGDDNGGGASESGAAYVFVRSGTSWSPQAKLTATVPTADEWFGCSVAISGETLAVGAPYDNNGGTDRGSAYVFVRSGTSWPQEAKLTPADPADGDAFGFSVGISGETLVVGARGDDSGSASDAGSAYVFVRSGTSWSEEAKRTASDAAAGDAFGYSVGISGELLVVGARGDDDGGSNSGSAYLFSTAAADNVRYYTGDANHNVTATIDAGTGEVVDRYVYTAYGEATVYDSAWASLGAPTEDGPLYCGYFFDAETANNLARNRYYTAALAMWISRDPIRYKAGDANLYRYVENAVLNRVDPSGNDSMIIAAVCGHLPGQGQPKLPWLRNERCNFAARGGIRGWWRGGVTYSWPEWLPRPPDAGSIVNYGCGGLCALRAGSEYPHVHLTPDRDVRCYTTYQAAYDRLVELRKQRKSALLFVVQTDNPLEPLDKLGTNYERFGDSENTRVDPSRLCIAGRNNFVSLIETYMGYTWECANHGVGKKNCRWWTGNPMAIIHQVEFPDDFQFNTYCVIPDSITSSPMVPPSRFPQSGGPPPLDSSPR